MHVLDLCSAPGGKTTYLAELMDNRGKVTACDIDARRLETVLALCQRLGIKGVETVLVKEDGEWRLLQRDATMDVPYTPGDVNTAAVIAAAAAAAERR